MLIILLLGDKMTQKELLYVEDAVEHEKSIVKICHELINNLEDDELITFIENEIDKHTNMQNTLINLMEEKANG